MILGGSKISTSLGKYRILLKITLLMKTDCVRVGTSKPEFPCEICGKLFTRHDNLNQHRKTHTGVKPFQCNVCNIKFTRRSDLTRHEGTAKHLRALAGPTSSVGKRRDPPSIVPPPKRRRNARNSNSNAALETFQDFLFHPEQEDQGDLLMFLRNVKSNISNVLHNQISTHGPIKWYLVCHVEFSRMKSDREKEYTVSFFRSKCETALMVSNLEEHLETAFEKVKNSCEEFESNGSGWDFEKVLHLELKVAKYVPFAASSYFPLPPALAAKKAVLNIQNVDHKCFLWSVIAALHPVSREDHANRVSHYEKYENELNVDGITFPTPVEHIEKFEKNNKYISVNVFAYEDGEVFPRRITKKKCDIHVNLLWVSNGEVQHYCLIRNMSRLLGNLTCHGHETYYCNYCLHRFMHERLLDEHEPNCMIHGEQKIKLPSESEKILKFDKYSYQLPIPFVIYADFESVLVKMASCTPAPETSNTTVISNHIACGYAYTVVGPDGFSTKLPKIYRGADAVDNFLTSLLKEEEEISKVLKQVVPVKLTPEEEVEFQEQDVCGICGDTIKLGELKVMDHCHVTGKFRSAAHSVCNLNFKLTHKIPVILHNLKGYDAHLIMQGIGKIKNRRIECIGQSMEKYISFSLGKLHFLDSLQFLNSSLSALVENLPPEKFKVMMQNIPIERIPLLLKKGVYPYEYMDSFKKFAETSLPPRDKFYNSLIDEEISIEEYQRAHAVWNAFEIKNMGEYHDLYLKTDVLLLADVFQNFRNLCLNYYKLDPCHVYTAPGLSWLACLRMTKVELELITDPNMHLFLERGIRGGVSMITHRYSVANNKYIKHYDPSRPSTFIMYLDSNSLYAFAMTQYLPHSNFEWGCADDFTIEKIMSLDDEGDIGHIFEVDLLYPENLHDFHNDYPLAPETLRISPDMISPYQKEMSTDLNIKLAPYVVKLTPNLYDKKNYVIHQRNLKLYMSLGLKLKKVHKVLTFTQKPWIRPYIEFNIECRKKSVNNFEKNFFKLMCNSVFGKTMENLRKHRNIELVQNEKRAKKLVSSPAFRAYKIFTEELVGVDRLKTCLTLNRPIYAGFAILEVSKTLMYDFHYSHIKRKYGDRARLLFTDTDSLTYEVETNDFYQDMLEDIDKYDTSDYPTNHPLHSTVNKKVVGKFKDELNGVPIEEFVGLRPKMYSILSSECEKKAAKGVAKSIIKNKMKHADYKACLFEKCLTREDMKRIRSESHQLQTVNVRKIALSPMDDKRYILGDGVRTLAYGHCEID